MATRSNKPKPKYPWYWRDGIKTFSHELVPFIKNILVNPADEVNRLVMADFIQETNIAECEKFAGKLREPGWWEINRSQSVAHYGLAWWSKEGSFGYCFCFIRQSSIPECQAKHKKLKRSYFVPRPLMLSSRDSDSWQCLVCIEDRFVGAV